MARFEREQSEYIEKVVATNRVSKTVKGGRDIAGEGGDEERGEYRENDKHDDQLDERKAAPVFEYFHENSFFCFRSALL